MRSPRFLRGVSTAFLAVAIASMSAPAFAQEIPQLPPVPYVHPPEQTMPVFELLAPTVFPACGTANLGVFLVRQSADSDIDATIDALGLPPAAADALKAAIPQSVRDYPRGTQIVTATTPVFVICGAVPRPPQQLNCLLDLQAQSVVNTAVSQAGAALPLGLHPVGDVVEQAIVVQDKLPPPIGGLGLAQVAAQVLVCAVPAGSEPLPGGDYSQPPSGPIAAPPVTPVAYPPQVPPASLFQPPVLLPRNPAPVPQRAIPVGDPVIYAAVWLLPLAMLVFGGYAGGSLTKEIKLSA